MQKGVGLHRSEGFGQLLFNPPFLLSDGKRLDWQLQKGTHDRFSFEDPSATLTEKDELILTFLKRKKKLVKATEDVDQSVNLFIENNGHTFDHITSSQWGQVRNIAGNAGKAEMLIRLLFDEGYGFLQTGQSRNQWMKKNCAEKLREAISRQRAGIQIEFTAKLASLMAKEAQKKQNLQTA